MNELTIEQRKDLDKFYSAPEAVTRLIKMFNLHFDFDDFDNIIEPAAGDGAILKQLPKRAIGLDLHPEADNIKQMNFFDYSFPVGRNVVVMNSPFGNRSKLAIDFFNKAADNASVIAQIVPCTFEKYSCMKQLRKGWHLIEQERLPENSFLLAGKPYKVRCSIQLWVSTSEFIKLGGTPSPESLA